MRTETKAFGSPSTRSSSLECLPRDDIFSSEVKKRIFFPDIGSHCYVTGLGKEVVVWNLAAVGHFLRY